MFSLTPQKDGVTSTETTNGKTPRDLGLHNTGKQVVLGVGLGIGGVQGQESECLESEVPPLMCMHKASKFKAVLGRLEP